MNNSDKILSLIQSFILIIVLCYLIFVTIDLNNIWIEIDQYQEKLKEIQLFLLSKTGNSV